MATRKQVYVRLNDGQFVGTDADAYGAWIRAANQVNGARVHKIEIGIDLKLPCYTLQLTEDATGASDLVMRSLVRAFDAGRRVR